MKRITKTLRALLNKIKDGAGDSFAEALVAILIAALGTAALVTMIVTSTNVIGESRDAMDKGYASEISVATAEAPVAGTVIISGSELQTTVTADVEVYASDLFYRYEEEG